jgi:hypothetical protein
LERSTAALPLWIHSGACQIEFPHEHIATKSVRLSIPKADRGKAETFDGLNSTALAHKPIRKSTIHGRTGY